jgi:3-oxoacyl-[acyl-carrier-protein] synthase-1
METETRIGLNAYVASDNIISSLGFTTDENMAALGSGKTGIVLHEDIRIAPAPFWASMINDLHLNELFSQYANPQQYTRFEKLLICSVNDALKGTSVDIHDNKTLLILSTTKGNIELLDTSSAGDFPSDRVYLWNTAALLQEFFQLANKPMVVSNACISGVMAVIIGARLIRSEQYEKVIITGADLVTRFVLSGFNSFLSLCQGPCKPFDKDRQGLSLGEAAGTIVLTNKRDVTVNCKNIIAGQGFSSNDANHISGPSRTGEGLFIAIKKTLEHQPGPVDYISAHGTATPYNDEMESIALTRAGLNNVPVNSLKGYWGHTLGAAGVIESVSCINALRNNIIFNTLGFSSPGVTQPISVVNKNLEIPVQTCLKMASGFGGSNASVLFYK